MTRAQRQAATSATAIERSISKARASVAADLKGMASGFAAAFAVSAFAGYAKQAFDYAAGLNELAQQVGVTVEQYQILSLQAKASGVEQGNLDSALKRLTITLGEAQAGSEKAIKAFASLGISKEQIDSARTAGDIYPLVAEGVKRLGGEALATAAAKGVMGKAVGGLNAMLVEGQAGYDEATRAARENGIVTNENARIADEAADEIGKLAESLKVGLANAIVSVVPLIRQQIQEIITLAQTAAWAFNEIEKLAPPSVRSTVGQSAKGVAGLFLNPLGTAAGLAKGIQEWVSGSKGNAARKPTSPIKPPPRILDTFDLSDAPKARGARKGPRGKSAEQLAREAERLQEERLRAAYQFASDERRAQMDVLRAQQDLAATAEERFSIDREILNLEEEQELAALQHAVVMKDMTREQSLTLQLLAVRRADLQRDAIAEREARQVREELHATEDTALDIQKQALDGESRLARTAAERREVEMRILDLAYEEERLRAQRVLDDKMASAADKQRAQMRLDSLPGRRANDEEALRRGTMGPMEAYLDSLPRTADEINEAFQRIQVEGLQSLTDGLVDAITGARSLGDVFKQVSKQIIADLLRIAVQRAVVGALGNALGGSEAGGGGFFGLLRGVGIISQTASSAPGGGIGGGSGNVLGMARGGSFVINGNRGVDTNLLSINGVARARVSHGERVTVTPAHNDNHRGGVTRVIVDTSPLLVGRIVEGDQRAMMGGSKDAQTTIHRRARRRFP